MTLIRGTCPVCDRLVGISTTQDVIGATGKQGTARYWLVDVHGHDGKLCGGSGRKI
jgi:hypothetical protein